MCPIDWTQVPSPMDKKLAKYRRETLADPVLDILPPGSGKKLAKEKELQNLGLPPWQLFRLNAAYHMRSAPSRERKRDFPVGTLVFRANRVALVRLFEIPGQSEIYLWPGYYFLDGYGRSWHPSDMNKELELLEAVPEDEKEALARTVPRFAAALDGWRKAMAKIGVTVT